MWIYTSEVNKKSYISGYRASLVETLEYWAGFVSENVFPRLSSCQQLSSTYTNMGQLPVLEIKTQSGLWTNAMVSDPLNKNHLSTGTKQFPKMPLNISSGTNMHRRCLWSTYIMTYLSIAGNAPPSSSGRPSWPDKDPDMLCHKKNNPNVNTECEALH
jgi:hypothetical protein